MFPTNRRERVPRLRYDELDWRGFRELGDRAKVPNTYTAITKQDGDWWIGWIEEIAGINCQERTREELLESLKVTLKEGLELNREEAIEAAVSDFTEELVASLLRPCPRLLPATPGPDRSAGTAGGGC